MVAQRRRTAGPRCVHRGRNMAVLLALRRLPLGEPGGRLAVGLADSGDMLFGPLPLETDQQAQSQRNCQLLYFQ